MKSPARGRSRVSTEPSEYTRLVDQRASGRRTITRGIQLLIGVATYEEPSAYHNPLAENLSNALTGLRRALATSTCGNFQGVALYAEWTTSDTVWSHWKP